MRWTWIDRARGPARPLSFARLMDEPAWRGRLMGDISAVFQVNRSPEVWRTLLVRADWHPRLLHGSDYPLPGMALLTSTGRLVREGVLSAEQAPGLELLRARNPLLFDFALKRQLAWHGQRLENAVFDTRRHFSPPIGIA